MSPALRARLRRDAGAIWWAAVRAVDPERLVRRAVRDDRGGLWIAGRRYSARRVWILGAGKASVAMARGAIRALGPGRCAGGLVIAHARARPAPPGVSVRLGDHPMPGARSLRAMQALLKLTARIQPGDLVLFLLSGGASALFCAPAPGLTLADKAAVTSALLRCGASIEELNVVRRHLSRVKGGGLLRFLPGARVVTLALSDVVGDPPAAIGSGPTVPDPSTYSAARAILRRYRLWAGAPPAVRSRIEAGLGGRVQETPKPTDPLIRRSAFRIVGNNRLALRAGRVEARRRGYRTWIWSDAVVGDTGAAAADHCAELRSRLRSATGPFCLLSGGETTVVVRGSGSGGRNQEFALASVAALARLRSCGLLAAGSDGRDGPTPAAGAWADAGSLARAQLRGLDPAEFLARNDSHGFFRRLGDLFISGPTGTNVMDLRILLARPSAA
jgi:glycerate-2-kinase